MSILYRKPSQDASYQVSIHLAKRFQRKRYFRNQPIRNKNCLWRPYLLMDRAEMSNLYREHVIDASYQVSEKKNLPIRNKNCLCQPCLLTDRDEMSNIYREHVTDTSYQISVHLAKRFQRKNRPIRNKNCLWQPCLLMNRDKMSNL